MRFVGLFRSLRRRLHRVAINGKVVNLRGEPVPNAPIVATNVATKALYKFTSSDKGFYTLADLPAGRCEISVALLGYNPYTQKDVTVDAATCGVPTGAH
jgi:hypothetical protein